MNVTAPSFEKEYDYDNQEYPRDFDIRSEFGGQQEIVSESVERYQANPELKLCHRLEFKI